MNKMLMFLNKTTTIRKEKVIDSILQEKFTGSHSYDFFKVPVHMALICKSKLGCDFDHGKFTALNQRFCLLHPKVDEILMRGHSGRLLK